MDDRRSSCIIIVTTTTTTTCIAIISVNTAIKARRVRGPRKDGHQSAPITLTKQVSLLGVHRGYIQGVYRDIQGHAQEYIGYMGIYEL